MIKLINSLVLLASLATAGTSIAQTVALPIGAHGVSVPIPKVPSTPGLPVPNLKPGPGKANPNHPGEKPPATEPFKFKWSSTGGIVACREAEECVRRHFPKSVGKPISVKRGPFVNKAHAPVSALVISENQYSLCYLTSLTTKAVNVCLPLKAPVIKGTKVRVITYLGKVSFLNFSIGPDLAKNMSGEQAEQIIKDFVMAFREAEAKAGESAARRYSGNLLPMEHMEQADEDGGGCALDDNGGGFCDGGDGGGWNDGPGGTFPDTSNGDGPVETPDGGSGDDDQIAPPGIIPLPPLAPPAPDDPIDLPDCQTSPNAANCVFVNGQKDPNRTDPDTGGRLPPSQPADGPWYCRLPIVRMLLCGGSDSAPEPTPPVAAPPYETPASPPSTEPLDRYRDGYFEATERCDTSRSRAESNCDLNYTLNGGSMYDRKRQRGEWMTPMEIQMLDEADTELRACRGIAENRWVACYQRAQKKYQE